MEVGDVVQLKSGGVRMTVESLKGDRAVCTWMSGGKPEQASFPKHILEVIPPASTPMPANA